MSFNVLTGEWHHETNTFSILPTTLESFHQQYYYDTLEEITKQRKGTKSSIGATFEAAEKYDWNLTQTIVASANPSGKLTNDTFDTMANQILSPLSLEKKYDGILLHLHGAMVTESYEDAEGELLQRVRNVVGNEIPIFVTLDLHGNISAKMASLSSCLLAVRTYPHIDYYEMGIRAADLLQATMEGKIQPYTVIGKKPLLYGLDGGKTHEGSPMKQLIDKLSKMEENDEILVGSVCAGFSAADIYDIGPSVTITIDLKNPKHHLISSSVAAASASASSPLAGRGEGNQENIEASHQYALKIANNCMDFVWETRDYRSEKHHSVNSVVSYAKEYLLKYEEKDCNDNNNMKPLVIADITDNPGSGHYGDATNLLKEMIEQELEDVIFYAIYDPAAVQQGISIGIGNIENITLGGKMDSKNGGNPLSLTGKVVTLSDGYFPCYGPMGGGCWMNMGLSMMFRINDNIDIIVISNNGQLLDIAQITSLGCDPINKKVIAVKSKQHYRASLTPIAGEIVTVDGGGLGSTILSGKGEYKHVRRPIWPLDKDFN
jgi:microcystin degradation protein MlrC